MDKKNKVRQKMTPHAKAAFMQRFRDDCARGMRGGVSEEELKSAVDEAAIKEVQES